MSDNLKSLGTQANPLNKQIAWWLVVVEGGLALALGLFIILQPEMTNAFIVQVVGGYVAVISGLALYRLFAPKNAAPAAPAAVAGAAPMPAAAAPIAATATTPAPTPVAAV